MIKATDPKAKKAQAPKASARGHALWKLQVRRHPRAASDSSWSCRLRSAPTAQAHRPPRVFAALRSQKHTLLALLTMRTAHCAVPEQAEPAAVRGVRSRW